jgi:glycosyltransferase involved in cell wall biosynthesis
VRDHPYALERRRGVVMLVLATGHGEFGGTERNSLELARALVRRGTRVVVLEVGRRLLAEYGKDTGVAFALLPGESFGAVTGEAWTREVERYAPDVIIRTKGWFGSQSRSLDLVALCHRAVYLGWEHHPCTSNWTTPRVGVLGTLNAYAGRRLHRLAVRRTLAVSRMVRDPLLTLQAFSPGRVDVIYPGVDFMTFVHSAAARRALRAEWGVPRDAYVVGYLGRLVAHKRVEVVLETFAALRSRRSAMPVWCVIAGVGPAHDELARLAERLGIGDRVRFVGWQESAPAAMSTIDLFLMPSTDEGLGMTLIEAAGCSCLVVASKAGGMMEVMDGALHEYQVAPDGGVDSWVQACESLLANSPGDLERLQLVFRAELRRKFDATRQWDATAEWVEQYLPAG